MRPFQKHMRMKPPTHAQLEKASLVVGCSLVDFVWAASNAALDDHEVALRIRDSLVQRPSPDKRLLPKKKKEEATP
jgi:hypothetical protein